eukprot:1162025-Pelagomonas_calceolata.AAC.10
MRGNFQAGFWGPSWRLGMARVPSGLSACTWPYSASKVCTQRLFGTVHASAAYAKLRTQGCARHGMCIHYSLCICSAGQHLPLVLPGPGAGMVLTRNSNF